jgi:hypothetical protein
MGLHRRRIGAGYDDRRASIARGADRPKKIGVGGALVLRLAGTRSLLGPLVDEAVLLANPSLVLEPDFYRRAPGKMLQCLLRACAEVFLNASMTPSSCLA